MLTFTPDKQIFPDDIRGCRLCDSSRIHVSDDKQVTGVCTRPEVIGVHDAVTCSKARSVNGLCGPEARYMHFEGL